MRDTHPAVTRVNPTPERAPRAVRALFGLLLLTGLSLGGLGCSGDDDDAPASPTPSATPSKDRDEDGSPASEDCNEQDPTVHPGADELCNGKDDDCDNQIDEDLVELTFYQDADEDGYGAEAVFQKACQAPEGYVATAGDCRDQDPDISPAKTETCNDVDDNCNSQVDEGLLFITWHPDNDLDGYGNPDSSLISCDEQPNFVEDGSDCDDNEPSMNPGEEEVCDELDNDCNDKVDDGLPQLTSYQDEDQDGYGLSSVVLTDCLIPSGFTATGGDCNDGDSSVSPSALELCNTVDDDCDGGTDEGLLSTYYVDADGDEHGSSSLSTLACSAPAGYVVSSDDCDDSRAATYPGASEVCDSLDNDCDKTTDEGVTTTWYRDADQDGYGSNSVTTVACSLPVGFAAQGGDCNDGASSVHPGGTEACDGLDNDCDNTVDEGIATVWYPDADHDGYGVNGSTVSSCTQPNGYAAITGDCNDKAATAHPGGTEACDGLDNDCDGSVDETGAPATWYLDSDHDGYGSSSVFVQSCTQPNGYASVPGDCDDANAAVYPAATEVCDFQDNNCNNKTDEGLTTYAFYPDSDGDGYGAEGGSVTACGPLTGTVNNSLDCNDRDKNINPSVSEILCDGTDQDCDGLADDHPDADADGFDVCASSVASSDGLQTDCNDADPWVNPLAYELEGDGEDSNCNGYIDWLMLVAGVGVNGYNGDGIAATSSQLKSPSDVAVDSQGILYIADGGNHRLRKVGLDGLISTVAGLGGAGSTGDGGPASEAGLSSPRGVVLGADGTVYVSEFGGYRIRRITADGIISTYAGTGVQGHEGNGGPATAAKLGSPYHMAFDTGGNLYFADSGNNRIRKIDANGYIYPVAGKGSGIYGGDGGLATAAELKQPRGVTVSSSGEIYIADTGNHLIRKVDLSGIITTVAGKVDNGTLMPGFSGDGGLATQAQLNEPESVYFDGQGNLLIADRGNHRIRLVDPEGYIWTVAGNGGAGANGSVGTATSYPLFSPAGISQDASGNLFMAEYSSGRVRKVMW